MKKCPSCSKEIQNEAMKCKHCEKLLNPVSQPKKRIVDTHPAKRRNDAEFINLPTKLGGIWNKYWGYIISIPIIIICAAHIILSIANLNKEEETAPSDANRPMSEQYAAPPVNANRPMSEQYAAPPVNANRPISEQYAKQRDSLTGMSDEQFKRVVDKSPDLAKVGVRYEMRNDKMIRYIPSAKNLGGGNYNRSSANDETYNTPDTVEDAGKRQHQEKLHREQQRQQDEIYR